MRTEIRDRLLYVEGDNRVYTRAMVRGLSIVVTGLKFLTRYDQSDGKISRRLSIHGQGALQNDYFVALGTGSRSNRLGVEIISYDDAHYKQYGDAWSHPEWGSKLYYFETTDDSHNYYLELSIPTEVIGRAKGQISRLLGVVK